MYKFIALIRTPDDVTAFERHYFGTHAPLAAKVPGVVKVEVARVLWMIAGEPAYHLVAELYFDSKDSMKAAMRSPEWAELGGDLRSWGGLELVTMCTAEMVS